MTDMFDYNWKSALEIIEDGVLRGLMDGRGETLRIHPALWKVAAGSYHDNDHVYGMKVVLDSQCPGMVVE